jgi:hypothetical protein
MSVGRNEPCPCGSGKKFKQCCLGKAPAKDQRFARLMILVALLCVGGGVAVGFMSTPKNGIMTATASLLIIGMIMLIRKPPSSRGKGGGDQINFGR